MAIYHASVKPVQRSKGRSSVAAAAYRAGEKLRDPRAELTHDYSKRKGVVFKEMVNWSGTREELWAAAELAEKRRDGTIAREYEVAIPHELDRAAQIELVQDYARALAHRHGVAVDVAIHDPADEQGRTGGNVHAHILTTTREVEEGRRSLGAKAQREWSDKRRQEAGLSSRKDDLVADRSLWAGLCNNHLALAQVQERVSHLSLEDQGIERMPQVHLGPAAIAIEARGEVSTRAKMAAEIEAWNDRFALDVETLANVQSQIQEEVQQTEVFPSPPPARSWQQISRDIPPARHDLYMAEWEQEGEVREAVLIEALHDRLSERADMLHASYVEARNRAARLSARLEKMKTMSLAQKRQEAGPLVERLEARSSRLLAEIERHETYLEGAADRRNLWQRATGQETPEMQRYAQRLDQLRAELAATDARRRDLPDVHSRTPLTRTEAEELARIRGELVQQAREAVAEAKELRREAEPYAAAIEELEPQAQRARAELAQERELDRDGPELEM